MVDVSLEPQSIKKRDIEKYFRKTKEENIVFVDRLVDVNTTANTNESSIKCYLETIDELPVFSSYQKFIDSSKNLENFLFSHTTKQFKKEIEENKITPTSGYFNESQLHSRENKYVLPSVGLGSATSLAGILIGAETEIGNIVLATGLFGVSASLLGSTYLRVKHSVMDKFLKDECLIDLIEIYDRDRTEFIKKSEGVDGRWLPEQENVLTPDVLYAAQKIDENTYYNGFKHFGKIVTSAKHQFPLHIDCKETFKNPQSLASNYLAKKQLHTPIESLRASLFEKAYQ